MNQLISFIQANGKWVAEMGINFCMVVGYLGFILVSSWQIKFQERQNKPQIDVKIEINDQDQLRLEVYNTGELDTEGVVYILVEPLKTREATFFDSEVIPNRSYQPLADRDKFAKYCFGKLEFKLGSGEDPYIYDPCPVLEYLEELTGQKRVPHIIRLEGSYRSVKYNDREFKFTKNYKLIPQEETWIKGRVSLNAVFAPEVEPEEAPDYEEYRERLED